jgi:hypothetical protein
VGLSIQKSRRESVVGFLVSWRVDDDDDDDEREKNGKWIKNLQQKERPSRKKRLGYQSIHLGF